VSERPLLIGLTGPIGCGKSTVAGMLAEVGATVIDADALAREVTGPGEPALDAIRDRFGAAVFAPDGSFDRSAMAAVVFSDRASLEDLEAIVHPEVRRRVDATLEAAAGDGAPFVVVEAIKLVEGGLAERCDEVWLIDCPADVQRERALARGTATDDLERRIAAQGPGLSERLSRSATRRISTEGSRDETRARVEDALADALAPRWLGSRADRAT
jgi:dephospho-CoA kinase